MDDARLAHVDQAAAVCYRGQGASLSFCFVTSLSTGLLTFPKGTIDPGETPVETALKEAEEEAGLTGEILGEPLGTYVYPKRGRELEVVVYLMRVDDAAEDWLEARLRRRLWLDPVEARARLPFEPLRELLDRALERLAAPARAGTDRAPKR